MQGTTIDVHVDQVLLTVVRILRACGIAEEVLKGSISKVLDSYAEEEAIEPLKASLDQHLACTEIVYTWRRAGEFLDSYGVPRILSVGGDGATFERLSELAADSYDPGVLLTYLETLGAVRVTGESVELLTDSVLAYSVGKNRRIAPETVLSHIAGFLGTVHYNITRAELSSRSRFERACYMPIPKNLLPVFDRLVEVRGQNFVDAIDEWLTRHRADDCGAEEAQMVGAGAYALASPSNLLKISK